MTREPTLAALVEPYLRSCQQQHRMTPLTARNVRSKLNSLAKVVGERPVRTMGQSHIERWLETRAKLAASTRRGDLSNARSFCKWLVHRGHIRKDPTAEIPAVKVPRVLPRALEVLKVGRLLEACPDARSRVMVLLMCQEGLRCTEVSSLQIGDIDFQTHTMRVVGKGQHERFLPISEETWTAIDTYLSEHPATSGPLVRSYREEWRSLAYDTISKMVSEWMSEAGIKRWSRDGVSAHALRHTAATDMLRAGAHLRDVQHALGHAHLATTEVYLPLVVHDLREAMGGRRYRGAGAS